MFKFGRKCLGLLAVLVGVLPSIADAGIIINEDNSHFYGSRSADDMTLEGLHAFVDQYADTEVSHLFLCPNAMRASFASKSREAIWELGEQEAPTEGHGKQWFDNARILHERGLDPYAIWIARCREKGIVPWLSMRMNDIHDVPNPKNFMHSTFWRDHPQFWRVPHEKAGGWTPRALDYGHPEVREHAMSFVWELLERYDPDGLELDWMRFGWHFAPGEEEAGAEILTEFMREARQLTQEWSKKRGHPIQLGARVPAHPDAAKGLGMDGVRWAREGLVDMLVPCPFWTTTDFDIPVELWRERLGDAAENVVIAPGIEHNSRASSGAGAVANDLASTRGFAASAWYRGADQIYLFNYMDSDTRPVPESDYYKLTHEGLSLDAATAAPRRHIQTFRDTVPPGFDNGEALPKETDKPATFNLHIGPKPETRGVTIIAGLADRDGLDGAAFSAKLNGGVCEPLTDGQDPGMYPGTARALQFYGPLETVTDGYNEITIEQTTGDVQQIVWIEIRIEP
jgi:hypothetical protein